MTSARKDNSPHTTLLEARMTKMGKIILPYFGAYLRTGDNRVFVAQDIHVEGCNQILLHVAIPSTIEDYGVINENEPPKETAWKRATYRHVRGPNSAGVSLYRLDKVEFVGSFDDVAEEKKP